MNKTFCEMIKVTTNNLFLDRIKIYAKEDIMLFHLLTLLLIFFKYVFATFICLLIYTLHVIHIEFSD